MVEAQATFLRYLRQVDVARAADAASASSTAVWLRNRYLVGIGSAHRWVKLAAEVEAAPGVVGDGVADGRVNLDQARVVVDALADLPDDIGADVREKAASELVRLCGDLDPAQLTTVGQHLLGYVAPEVAEEAERQALERAEARAMRKRGFTMTPDGYGVRLSGRLTPEGAAMVRAAIDPLCAAVAVADRTAEQRRADALVDVCRLALKADQLPGRAQMMVGLDYDVLKRELGAGVLDTGERVTPETARRIACDAGIVPIVPTRTPFRTRSARGSPLTLCCSRTSRPRTPTDRWRARTGHSCSRSFGRVRRCSSANRGTNAPQWTERSPRLPRQQRASLRRHRTHVRDRRPASLCPGAARLLDIPTTA